MFMYVEQKQKKENLSVIEEKIQQCESVWYIKKHALHDDNVD